MLYTFYNKYFEFPFFNKFLIIVSAYTNLVLNFAIKIGNSSERKLAIFTRKPRYLRSIKKTYLSELYTHCILAVDRKFADFLRSANIYVRLEDNANFTVKSFANI